MRRIRFTFSSAPRWSETEMNVAEILCDLDRVCLLTSVPFSWSFKRKRTSIHNKAFPFPNKRLCTFNGGGSVAPKGGASSLAVPLSCPTTQSEEKTKHYKIQNPQIKNKELLLKTIEDMKGSQAFINRLSREEIENVKKNFDKERKQKFGILNLKNGEKVQLDDNGLTNTSKSTAENEEEKKEQHQHQQIHKQMPLNHHNQTNGPSSIGLGRNINSNSNGPIALPALNLSIAEITANRIVAATQARRRRLQIIRVKKNRKSNHIFKGKKY